MQKEESGRRKINQWTRYITIIICVFQAPGYLFTYVDAAAHGPTASSGLSPA
jgi:preprotein translocase subunit SecY